MDGVLTPAGDPILYFSNCQIPSGKHFSQEDLPCDSKIGLVENYLIKEVDKDIIMKSPNTNDISNPFKSINNLYELTGKKKLSY